MKIATCNIRDARADDGVDNWQRRRELCARVIREIDADIVCFQELRQTQRDYIAAALPDYDSFGLAESAGATDAPNAIFWRRAAFSCIDKGGCWLAEQPLLAGSRSWGSHSIRLMNFVLLQRADGKYLRVVNTHLDDGSQFAREQQARALIGAIDAGQRSGELQILCGDMNGGAGNAVIALLYAAGWRDCYAQLYPARVDEFTYHAFQGPAYDPRQHPGEPQSRIDWIFARGVATIAGAEIIRANAAGRFPSDHYFVSATLI